MINSSLSPLYLLCYFISPIVLAISFYSVPSIHKYYYSSEFLIYFIAISFFAYTFLFFFTQLFLPFSNRLLKPVLRFAKSFIRSIRPFFTLNNCILAYASLVLVERFVVGGSLPDNTFESYNDSLSSLPLGFKAIQQFLFMLSTLLLYSSTSIRARGLISRFILLAFVSLLTYKRFNLLISLVYLIFYLVRYFNLSYYMRRIWDYRLPISLLKITTIIILFSYSFTLIFGFVAIIRFNSSLDFLSLITYGFRVLGFYIQMPISNFAYYFSDPSCPAVLSSLFIPNSFLSDFITDCSTDMLYSGVAYGTWGTLTALPLLSTFLFLLLCTFYMSLYLSTHLRSYLLPILLLYLVLFFHANLLINTVFTFSNILAAVFVSAYRDISTFHKSTSIHLSP